MLNFDKRLCGVFLCLSLGAWGCGGDDEEDAQGRQGFSGGSASSEAQTSEGEGRLIIFDDMDALAPSEAEDDGASTLICDPGQPTCTAEDTWALCNNAGILKWQGCTCTSAGFEEHLHAN